MKAQSLKSLFLNCSSFCRICILGIFALAMTQDVVAQNYLAPEDAVGKYFKLYNPYQKKYLSGRELHIVNNKSDASWWRLQEIDKTGSRRIKGAKMYQLYYGGSESPSGKYEITLSCCEDRSDPYMTGRTTDDDDIIFQPNSGKKYFIYFEDYDNFLVMWSSEISSTKEQNGQKPWGAAGWWMLEE